MPSLLDVTIAPGEADVPAALALPDTAGTAPGVVVIHEMLGLNDDIRRIARRFAAAGYVALAPDFFAGLGPRPICMVRLFRGVAEGERGRPFRRVDLARTWLSARPEVAGGPIGLAGFCFGGGFALLYAAARGRAAARGDGDALGAVAPFYGSVPRDEAMLDGLCPTVASYGGRDRTLRNTAARLEGILRRQGVDHDVKEYGDAGHSFANRLTGLAGAVGPFTPMHAGYVESAAEDAWARTLDFFARHLRPTGRRVA